MSPPQHGTSAPQVPPVWDIGSWWPCPLPKGGLVAVPVSLFTRVCVQVSIPTRIRVQVSVPDPCPAVQLLPAASNALMLPDARAHHKHVVTSSRGHGSQQDHLPWPPARGHPALTPEAPVATPLATPAGLGGRRGREWVSGLGLMVPNCTRREWEGWRVVAPQKTPLPSQPGCCHPWGTGRRAGSVWLLISWTF